MERKIKQRKLNRLENFDYSTEGWYFVTICTNNREEYFGNITNGKMFLNQYGRSVKKFWYEIPFHYKNVEIGEFIIMPNHVHGIVVIKNVGAIFKSPNKTGEMNFAPTNTKPSLSAIIKWLKSISTIEIRRHYQSFRWQKSFYDHIIRDKNSLGEICQYIRNNPSRWKKDRNNVENLYM